MQHESNLLLPCPFCGSTGAIIKEESNFYGFCGDCETEGPWSPMHDRALAAWNTRATAAPVVVGEDVADLLPGTYYMDPPDGGDVTVMEQLRRMAKDAKRYRWLRDSPGAKLADGYGLLVVTDAPNKVPRYIGPVRGDELDREIDKALTAALAGD